MVDLLLPVGNRRTSSWGAHTRRSPRSSEPGTDWYCPIGTPILAPADGVIWGSGESIGPATGRWVGIDFDNGMSWRTLHHSRNVIISGRVRRGQVYALSGASGYGEEDWSWNVAETGGAHVHGTLWPTHVQRFGYGGDGRPFTVDFMEYAGGSLAGGGSTTFNPHEEDEMLALNIKDSHGLTHKAILGPGIFRHLVGGDNPERIKNIVRSDDQWLDTDLTELPVLLRTYGCDLNIWDVQDGRFCVLDPLDGSVRPGNVWTAEGASRAQIRSIS